MFPLYFREAGKLRAKSPARSFPLHAVRAQAEGGEAFCFVGLVLRVFCLLVFPFPVLNSDTSASWKTQQR